MGSYSLCRMEKMIMQELDQRNPIFLKAVEKAVNFFAVYDVIERTHHAEMIRCFFGMGKNRRKTIEVIAIEEYCTSRTLYRYKKKYIDCIMLFVNADSLDVSDSYHALTVDRDG